MNINTDKWTSILGGVVGVVFGAVETGIVPEQHRSLVIFLGTSALILWGSFTNKRSTPARFDEFTQPPRRQS